MKNKTIQALRDIRDRCGECEGTGAIDHSKYIVPAEHSNDCPTCQGTGIDRNLEFGCEFKHNYDLYIVNCVRCTKRYEKNDSIFAFSCTGDKHSFPPTMNEEDLWDSKYRVFNKDYFNEEKDYIEILGRPLTLQDVLVMIQNKYPQSSPVDYISLSGCLMKGDKVLLKIDLTQPIETQQSVLEEIYKLVK